MVTRTNNGIQGVKGVKDVLGSGRVEFYPALERVDKVQLFGNNFILQDAKLISDWDGEFGTTSFYLVKVKLIEDGKEFTTIMGGTALMKQLRKLVDGHKLPVAASINIIKSERGNEYYILDNPVAKSEP
jgi:hypothetical protein